MEFINTSEVLRATFTQYVFKKTVIKTSLNEYLKAESMDLHNMDYFETIYSEKTHIRSSLNMIFTYHLLFHLYFYNYITILHVRYGRKTVWLRRQTIFEVV